MKKILLALGMVLGSMSIYALDTDWGEFQQKILTHQQKIPGWCNPEKARCMMDLIYELKPEICVEIGVFGGSSIFPTANTLKFLNKGHVYAIDPWKNANCLEGYTNDDPNYQWWSRINLEEIYQGFLKMLNDFQLNSYCMVLRMTGTKAVDLFADESIDILYIDGNHTEDVALNDARRYLPKVKKGGYIWFDDADWPSTLSARNFLFSHCTKDEVRSTNQYLLFIK